MSLMEERRPQVYAPMVWRSFAKINLYLDVLRKRRDGYHNIETIFQTVNLYDELTFVNDNHLSMTCSGAGLDTGRSNLVYRAAALLQEETGCMRGARIHLEKRIPIAAGLAGGSGNAAATLSALNKLWDLRLPLGRLTRLARVLGPLTYPASMAVLWRVHSGVKNYPHCLPFKMYGLYWRTHRPP